MVSYDFLYESIVAVRPQYGFHDLYAIVKDFWFEFKDGQVVDYDAKEGKEVLTSILETDEGSKYLGEIALVPYGSPISALDTLFYETLIDENASCHFALGASYNECIEKGLEMSEEELLEHGLRCR